MVNRRKRKEEQLAHNVMLDLHLECGLEIKEGSTQYDVTYRYGSDGKLCDVICLVTFEIDKGFFNWHAKRINATVDGLRKNTDPNAYYEWSLRPTHNKIMILELKIIMMQRK